MLINNKILKFLKEILKDNKLLYFIGGLTLICDLLTFFVVFSAEDNIIPYSVLIIGLALLDLFVLLVMIILLSKVLLSYWISQQSAPIGGRLQRRIVVVFSLVAAIPTITVAVFFVFFFNFGIQKWFDKRINTVLSQSLKLTEFYLDENKTRLKSTAMIMANSLLSEMYHELIHQKNRFNAILNYQAQLGSLDEAIIFQKSTHTILAQTALSFSLAFVTIPSHLLERAENGEVVELETDPTKIRILIKLQNYDDAYLIIGKLIDRRVLSYLNKTHGANQEYTRLKNKTAYLQIKFSIIFITIALLLLLASIATGFIFAKQIFQPIKDLVAATEVVKLGNLNVQVRETNTNDELDILTSAFNRMVKQLDRQNKDLVIAQKALAWADVARRVAHEINNPLTPIQLSAGMLGKKFSKEVSDAITFNRYVNTILRHTEDIKKIVTEFTTFAKMPVPNFVRCDLVVIIKELIASQQIINEKIKYQFITKLKELDFVADITQINQIMVNLLKNAEESLECKNVKVKIIKVLLQQSSAETVSIEVQDTGGGFPQNLINYITEPYVTTRLQGSGLGLAIVKKIVEDHLGTLEIANLKGGGASVKITFSYLKLLSMLK